MINRLFTQDLPGVKHLQPTDWPDIMPFIKFYCSANFCCPIKYSLDNRIVGIGCSITHGDTAWLAHIIVSEEMRNRGVGFSITKFLLDHLFKNGIKSVSLIATKLGEPVYRRIGFERETEYVHFKDVLFADSDSNNIVQFREGMERDVLRLDREISGEDRTRLLSPYLSTSKVFIDARGSIEGLYLPSLGEGLIVALTERAGIAMLQHRHSHSRGCGFPVSNKAAVDFLNGQGFFESGRRVRMRWGDVVRWKPECLYNRIGGNLG